MIVVLFYVYMAAGYWATARTVYRNKILIGTGSKIFVDRVITGTLFGWFLIPWALLSRK